MYESTSPNPNNIESQPFGNYDEALANHSWDAVVLQPFSRLLNDNENYPCCGGDIGSVQSFIDFTLAESPDADFYLYATWPIRELDPDNPGSYLPFDYQEKWDSSYSGDFSGATMRTRDYHYQLIEAVRQNNPEVTVNMIPVGDVLYELDERIKAGLVPGLDPEPGVEQFYVDLQHFNPLPHEEATVGTYVAGLTAEGGQRRHRLLKAVYR